MEKQGSGEIPQVFSCEANYSQKGRSREGVDVMNSVDYELCVTNSNEIYIKSPKEDISTAYLTNVQRTFIQGRYPLQ